MASGSTVQIGTDSARIIASARSEIDDRFRVAGYSGLGNVQGGFLPFGHRFAKSLGFGFCFLDPDVPASHELVRAVFLSLVRKVRHCLKDDFAVAVQGVLNIGTAAYG